MKDNLGLLCSGLCLCHCLLTPLLLTAGGLGLLGSVLGGEIVHQVLAVPVVVLALLSFPSGYRRHHTLAPTVLGGTGATLLAGAVLIGGAWEEAASIVGALLLLSGHAWNRHLLRCCQAQASVSNGAA